ncbi:glycosyltransferase [Bacteroides fragilis]|uniref:glycosyltransferase n=1 Tax=Bacteroides fragilis TaxID=817 RepID=UPI001CFF8530|nr:glycosyltransferase [Bacteroides fragilis]
MKVSIIILNYNTSRLTLNCINSIHKYLPNGTYEIIVVDNASQETDYQHLTENLSGQEITIIRNKINSGFGAGNMVGANIAQGKYLCFLNNNTELLEDCISPLCSYLKEKSSNRMHYTTAIQQTPEGSTLIQSSNRYSI